ncbi:MAG TPA: sigma-54 dependent transcriptional regulator [Bacteroidales bacterium]|jgi:DNA-binding NtrC family response regulator|nr:sigma-54 dependent transcriptional regulator [Bacteroidales bacterium]HQJ81995.1 sigma-54 dependent transcriptional regulator [Bacteroidales bacterium]
MSKILVIDDEKAIRNTLRDVLEYEKHEVDLAEDGETGIELFSANTYDIVLCDIKMQKMDGLEVLHRISEISSATPVIMISGHGNIDTAVEAIKKGAYDFLEKPLDLNRLLITIRNATDKSKLISQTQVLRNKVSKMYEIVGESEAITKVKEMIDRVAPTEARVLITGANGTGKELVAHQIHEKSHRAKGPFVEVNCAAIPSELIESELFGHEKGSFTSAIKQRIGKFEQASGGTLFLDEIGDMSLSAQAKVLRALQENKISRVGSDKDISVNVRIVTATNKNIKKEIENNTFREDLYHRLSVILIHVPTLNEREEDIPLLADHFNTLICNEYGMSKKVITKDAIGELQKITWTGNIREFRNVLERLIILCKDEIRGADVLAYARPVSGGNV